MGIDCKLTSVIYRYFYKCRLHKKVIFTPTWLKHVHDIWNLYWLSYVWIDQDFRNINWLKIYQRYSQKQYVQE